MKQNKTKPKIKSRIKSEGKIKKETIVSVPLWKKVLRACGYVLAGLLLFILLVFVYINLPVPINDKKIPLGVTFSNRYAQDIGLDWKQTFIAILDDIKVRNIRVPVYWDKIETADGQYDFSDVDWQLDQARQRNAHIILAMGKKVPRWPECYVPSWVGSDPQVIQEKLISFESAVINRYKDNHPEIYRWQIENEPFLDFGICGSVDPTLLDAEIANAKSIDSAHPIVVTDSGELSLWYKAASRADIFGTTMYREVYSAKMGHWRYPIGPNFFKMKELFIKLFAHQKNPIVIELQGEPWVQGWTTSAPVETQLASMNASILKDNIEFAKKTNFSEVYVWGVEWWYWMKVQQNNPTLWEQARSLYSQG